MFSGIVQALGRVATSSGGLRIESELQAKLGASIAVNGVCLTVVRCAGGKLDFDLAQSTRSCTTLGALAVGASVNLEPALRLGDSLDGHLVSGHVDAVGTIAAIDVSTEGRSLLVNFDRELSAFIAAKGSVCVDGISLTVAETSDDAFRVHIVPFTWGHTNLAEARVGKKVNLEVDLVARYLQRIVQARSC